MVLDRKKVSLEYMTKTRTFWLKVRWSQAAVSSWDNTVQTNCSSACSRMDKGGLLGAGAPTAADGRCVCWVWHRPQTQWPFLFHRGTSKSQQMSPLLADTSWGGPALSINVSDYSTCNKFMKTEHLYNRSTKKDYNSNVASHSLCIITVLESYSLSIYSFLLKGTIIPTTQHAMP